MFKSEPSLPNDMRDRKRYVCAPQMAKAEAPEPRTICMNTVPKKDKEVKMDLTGAYIWKLENTWS